MQNSLVIRESGMMIHKTRKKKGFLWREWEKHKSSEKRATGVTAINDFPHGSIKLFFEIRKCSHLLQREQEATLKCSFEQGRYRKSSPFCHQRFHPGREKYSPTHALIKKRFLFIRQHATQQQANNIAYNGSGEYKRGTKKSSQNVDAEAENLLVRTFLFPFVLVARVWGWKAWKALNYMKIYIHLHPADVALSRFFRSFTASLLSYTSHFPTGLYIKKTRKPNTFQAEWHEWVWHPKRAHGSR